MTDYRPIPSSVQHWHISRYAIGILLLGVAARIWLFYRIPLINPDGFLYIQQAKAIYYGLFSSVLDCYFYLSPYPPLIALFYPLTGDWIVTGQWINIIFGTLVLIPLYLLLRGFFKESITCLVILVITLLPRYIQTSTYLVRDPMFWFFSVFGLYLFVLHIEHRRFGYLLSSSFCFAVCAWARIEGSLFILVSAGFLIAAPGKHRWKDTLVFLSPYIVMLMTGILAGQILNIQLSVFLKPDRALSRAVDFVFRYQTLRNELKILQETYPLTHAVFFFREARSLIWFIALGYLILNIIKTLCYLPFIPLVAGLIMWTPKIKTDKRISYLWVLSLMALGLLYSQIIYNWIMERRFLAIFLFPAAVFIGAGMERLIMMLQSRFNWRQNTAIVISCLVILALLLPQTIRANYNIRHITHKEIGLYIADLEKNQRQVSICGSFEKINSINFFANLKVNGAPCIDDATFIRSSDSGALQRIRDDGFDYFVWDSESWGNITIETTLPEVFSHFEKLKEWSVGKSESLILYRIIS